MSYKLESEKQRQNCKFPPGGWECSKCCNYNFKGRKSCHRCKKVKTAEDMDGMPEHLFENQDKDSNNSETFEMINFKHKAQKRLNTVNEETISVFDNNQKKDKTEKKLSYMKKLSSFAEQWEDGNVDERSPMFAKFDNQCEE